MEDVEIIRLYWARDESAIPAAAEKYGNYCASIAQNLLGNREDAEECVNDTWLRAWNAIPPQRPGILSAFLGTITRNLALDLFQRRTAQKRGGGTAAVLEELEGLSFHYAALYETTMKDGTQYHLLRAFYTDGEVVPGILDGDTGEQKPNQLRDALAVFVMDYEPDTDKTIHQREDLPAFLERDWDGSTFHFACGEVWIGVTVNGSGLSSEEILSVLHSIQ